MKLSTLNLIILLIVVFVVCEQTGVSAKKQRQVSKESPKTEVKYSKGNNRYGEKNSRKPQDNSGYKKDEKYNKNKENTNKKFDKYNVENTKNKNKYDKKQENVLKNSKTVNEQLPVKDKVKREVGKEKIGKQPKPVKVNENENTEEVLNGAIYGSETVKNVEKKEIKQAKENDLQVNVVEDETVDEIEQAEQVIEVNEKTCDKNTRKSKGTKQCQNNRLNTLDETNSNACNKLDRTIQEEETITNQQEALDAEEEENAEDLIQEQ